MSLITQDKLTDFIEENNRLKSDIEILRQENDLLKQKLQESTNIYDVDTILKLHKDCKEELGQIKQTRLDQRERARQKGLEFLCKH